VASLEPDLLRSLREVRTPSWGDEVACAQSSNRGWVEATAQRTDRQEDLQVSEFGQRNSNWSIWGAHASVTPRGPRHVCFYVVRYYPRAPLAG
jgi:hypothetical protein